MSPKTYWSALNWMASHEQDLRRVEPEALERFMSVHFIADLSGKKPRKVAQDLLKLISDKKAGV